jgi:hypothetical protein
LLASACNNNNNRAHYTTQYRVLHALCGGAAACVGSVYLRPCQQTNQLANHS